MADSSWYVVHTKPQKEENVHQLFVQGGFESFLPKIKTFFSTTRNNSKILSDRIKPLFPSYLFIRLQQDKWNDLRTIKYTRGVHKILGGLDGPVSIPFDIIQIIQERTGDRGFIEQGAFFKPKDKVLVKRGVLKDLIGILEKPVDDKGRVEVLFKIVHHQMRAKVFCGDLEKMG